MSIHTGGGRSLAKACAPFFVFLTSFRRNSETYAPTADGLHTALERELAKVQNACEQDRRLQPLFQRVHYALVATADQVVLSSAWPHRHKWSIDLMERRAFGTAEGGKKFFRVADETLDDPTAEAAEAAEVLFHCMGLGFQGEFIDDRRELERRRRQLYDKARLGARSEHLTPDAYGRNATLDLARLPTAGIVRMTLIGVGSLIFALVINRMTIAASSDNNETLRKISQRTEQIRTNAPAPSFGR